MDIYSDRLNESLQESDETRQALATAQDAFNTLRFDARFMSQCETAGIDPHTDSENFNPYTYWRFFALQAYNLYRSEIKNGADPRQAILTWLTRITPQMELDTELTQMAREGEIFFSTRSQDSAVRERLRAYRILVGKTAQAYPDLRPSVLEAHLLPAADLTVQTAGITRSAVVGVHSNLRGQLNEMRVFQALKAARRKVLWTNEHQDIGGGADIIFFSRGASVMVDVKASRRSVDAVKRTRNDESYAIDPERNRVLITINVPDEELGDRFFMPDIQAREIGVRMAAELDEAASRLWAAQRIGQLRLS